MFNIWGKSKEQPKITPPKRLFNHKELIIDRYDRFLDQTQLDIQIGEGLDEANWHFSCVFPGIVHKSMETTGIVVTTSWHDQLGLLGNSEPWQGDGEYDDEDEEEEGGGVGLWTPNNDRFQASELTSWKEGVWDNYYHLKLEEDPVVVLDDARRIVMPRHWTVKECHDSHRVVRAEVILAMAGANKIEVSWGNRLTQLDHEHLEAIRDFANRLTDPSRRARGPYPNQAGDWIHWKTLDGQLDRESLSDEEEQKAQPDFGENQF